MADNRQRSRVRSAADFQAGSDRRSKHPQYLFAPGNPIIKIGKDSFIQFRGRKQTPFLPSTIHKTSDRNAVRSCQLRSKMLTATTPEPNTNGTMERKGNAARSPLGHPPHLDLRRPSPRIPINLCPQPRMEALTPPASRLVYLVPRPSYELPMRCLLISFVSSPFSSIAASFSSARTAAFWPPGVARC
jgi:hypothetical protein